MRDTETKATDTESDTERQMERPSKKTRTVEMPEVEVWDEDKENEVVLKFDDGRVERFPDVAMLKDQEDVFDVCYSSGKPI